MTTTTEEKTTPVKDKKRSVWPLWLMIILFALPNAAIIYYHYSGDRPNLKQTNRGILISPMMTPKVGVFTKQDGSPYDLLPALSGKWVLLMVTGSDCQTECQKTIFLMRQMRRALSIDRSRVERVLILTDNNLPASFETFLQDYPLMHIITGPDNEVQSLVQQLSKLTFKPESIIPVEGSLYLIDPEGRFILTYPQGTEPKDLLKDLHRLLKISQMG